MAASAPKCIELKAATTANPDNCDRLPLRYCASMRYRSEALPAVPRCTRGAAHTYYGKGLRRPGRQTRPFGMKRDLPRIMRRPRGQGWASPKNQCNSAFRQKKLKLKPAAISTAGIISASDTHSVAEFACRLPLATAQHHRPRTAAAGDVRVRRLLSSRRGGEPNHRWASTGTW